MFHQPLPCSSCTVEEDQEALGAAELAGFERERVVFPRLVAGDGPHVFLEFRLLQGPVLDLPVPLVRPPALESRGEVRLEEHLVALRDLDVLELGLRGPGADADRPALQRALDRRGLEIEASTTSPRLTLNIFCTWYEGVP